MVPLGLFALMTSRSTSLLRASYLYVSISTALGGTLLFWVGSYHSICGRLFSCVEMGHFRPWRGVGLSAATSHLSLRFCPCVVVIFRSLWNPPWGYTRCLHSVHRDGRSWACSEGGVRAPSSVNSYGFVGQLGPSRVPQRYLRPIWINMCDVR